MALISVGCKLPQGLIIELGYKIVPGGVERGPDYQQIQLAGANQHSTIVGTLRSPSPRDLRPGITNNVDEALFDAWMKAHANTNIVKNGLVFKAKNAGEATAKAADIAQKPSGLEAIDPTKVKGLKKFNPDDQGGAEGAV
jgi:hypothetical protein